MPIRIPRREPAPQMVCPQTSKERSQVTSMGSPCFPFRKTRIKSLSDFTLEFLYIARNNLTRIVSYLRKAMTKLCIKILVESDSAIESAFP